MKMTMNMVLHYHKYDWEAEGRYLLFSCDMSGSGYLPVGPVTVEVEVPDDFDPRAAEIAVLEQRKEQIRADFAKAVTDIERRIAELKAIEYDGPVGVED